VRPGHLLAAQRQRVVTGRPTFGEFLTSVREHDAAATACRGRNRRGGDVQEVTDSLLRMVTIMGRYVEDIRAVPGDMRSQVSPSRTAWGRARIDARDALNHAAAHLRRHSVDGRQLRT
jgi:hypothetical protein